MNIQFLFKAIQVPSKVEGAPPAQLVARLDVSGLKYIPVFSLALLYIFRRYMNMELYWWDFNVIP